MRILYGGMAATVWFIALAPVGHAAERFEYESKHMGTIFRIVLYAAEKPAADAAAKAAFARIAALDKTMSDYDPQSELMRLCKANDAAPGKPIPASDDLVDVLAKAKATAAASGGAFDPTVGPLVKLWRIARKTQQLPDATELASAKKLVGHEMLGVDAKAKTVSLERPGMRLDLGGIGKGYAADAALAILREKHGISRALVAGSGDIAVGDPPPEKTAWEVEIAPLGTGMPARTVYLANAAVSTSGDLFQFAEIGGVRYSHVLNPATGLGLTGRRSVTVIARTGTQADSLSKAASILPPAKALALIESIDGAATFIAVKETDDAKESTTASERFTQYAKKPEK